MLAAMPGTTQGGLARRRGGSGRRRFVALVALLVALTSCRPRETVTVTVLAAASLAGAFSQLAAAFEAREPGVAIELSFAGSQLLATQLLEGAPAQLFASADPAQLDRVAEGRALAGRRGFASNELGIVVPAASAIDSVADLSAPGVRVVLAGEAVPAGRYAREALAQLGVAEAVAANVRSHESDVRGVVAKLRLGEADAGLAYRTEARRDPALRFHPLPRRAQVAVRYELALIGSSYRAAEGAAARFAAFVAGPEGQAILAAHGFSPLPSEAS